MALFLENTAMCDAEVKDEVMRYITWPGQVHLAIIEAIATTTRKGFTHNYSLCGATCSMLLSIHWQQQYFRNIIQ